jgi:hypothetical protein
MFWNLVEAVLVPSLVICGVILLWSDAKRDAKEVSRFE